MMNKRAQLACEEERAGREDAPRKLGVRMGEHTVRVSTSYKSHQSYLEWRFNLQPQASNWTVVAVWEKLYLKGDVGTSGWHRRSALLMGAPKRATADCA